MLTDQPPINTSLGEIKQKQIKLQVLIIGIGDLQWTDADYWSGTPKPHRVSLVVGVQR